MKKMMKMRRLFTVILMLLTAVYPVTMVMLSGAGIVYNRESYGSSLCIAGALLTVSGAAMTAGALLTLSRRRAAAAMSVILSAAGLVLCLCMLRMLTDHADRAGWSDALTMTPVSEIYRRRILPAAVPALLSAGDSVMKLVKLSRAQKDAEDAPGILDDKD